jgi:tartrate-resistant acid phosphatase type 5
MGFVTTLVSLFSLFLLSLCMSVAADAEVTYPTDYVMPLPECIVIPKDVQVKASKEKIAERGIRILVFGDSGTGDKTQNKVTAAMESFCARNECDFGLMMGDNIHPIGVSSPDDPQLVEKIDKPYAVLGLPIFAILGEHDWGRNGLMYNWKAQIAHGRTSPFWHMPSDVYSVTFEDLKIFALNTNAIPICKEQVDWLKSELEKSKARWNIVIGHKPINAYGEHGDIEFMIKDVLPILCGKADIYIAAHEHNEQVLRADCGLPLVISGSAGKLRRVSCEGPRSLFCRTEPGFGYIEVKKAELVIKMVSGEGEVLYELSVPKKGEDK